MANMDPKIKIAICVTLVLVAAYFLWPKDDFTKEVAQRQGPSAEVLAKNKAYGEAHAAQAAGGAKPSAPAPAKVSAEAETHPTVDPLPPVLPPTLDVPPLPHEAQATPPQVEVPAAPLAVAPYPVYRSDDVSPSDESAADVETHGRFVYLEFPRFVLRLKVASTLTKKEFAVLGRALKGACVAAEDAEPTSRCKSMLLISSVDLDRLAAASKTVDPLSADSFTADVPQGFDIRLTCDKGQPQCLSGESGQRRFLISSDTSVPRHAVADGGDLIALANKKKSARAPASTDLKGLRIRRAYVTIDSK